MPTKTREILIGFGKCKQSAIATANAVGGIWCLNKLNASMAIPKLNTENDAPEFGKGHEFAANVYKTSWDVSGAIEKYLSAEFAAWVMSFGLGKSVKTGTTPNWIYTCTPLDPVTDGIELPYFSFIEQIRPGASVVIDHMAVGCAIEDWTLTVGSGPGRANSKLTANFIGCGKDTEPSGITLPAATAEKLLPSSSLTCTINGVDYVTNKNIVSLEATWKNNLRGDDGFYPGSGFQTDATPASGAIRGRLETGDREAGFTFSARFEHDSDELTKLKAQTEGTAVCSLTFDSNSNLTLTYHRVAFSVVELEDTNGIVTVKVTCTPLWHTSNHLLTVVAKCTVDKICEAES
jgi:hypothetical protein